MAGIQKLRRPDLNSLRGDIYGGITAAVVALPLALAFGVASGIGPIAGLYGAIAVGFFAAVVGGTPAQISGPTGPMTIVMASIVAAHANSLPEAFAIVFLGGVFQIVFGLLRVGRFVSYTPSSVVSGFMSGIGVIIIFIQILPFFGLPTSAGGPMGAINAWSSIPSGINVDAVVLGAIALAIGILWPRFLQSLLPAPLAALIVGTIFGVAFFPNAPVIGIVPSGLPTIRIPSFPISDLVTILQPALILALLGSIDSLLTSLVADSITRTRHKSNRELIGQGLGNIAAGLIGGLPGAGATMRTVVNVRAGGRSRLSGLIHAVLLLALVLGLGPVAEKIPHAVLAGILLKIGWDIIDWGYIRRAHRAPKDKVFVMIVTLGLTVFVDLITAVAVGLILAGFVTARWMEKEELKGLSAVALPEGEDWLNHEEHQLLLKYENQIGIIRLRGHFSYASARELVQRGTAAIMGHKAIIFDFTNAAHVDTSAGLAIEELLNEATDQAEAIYLAGLSGPTEKTLNALGALEKVDLKNITPTLLEAISRAGESLER